MKKHSSLAVLAFVTALVGASVAHAGPYDTRSVVHSSDGVEVTNSFDQCVRVNSNAGFDECGPAVVQETVKTVHKHKEIGSEQRTVYFAFNRSDLSQESKAKLDSLTAVLKSQDDVQSALIVGYADRIGSHDYNDKLSQRRANAVRDYIVSRGYMNASVAETRWLGKTAPITNCSGKMKRPELIGCLQQDRRVEVEIQYTDTVATR